MKIAIISDIHENIHNLVQFFLDIEDKNAEHIIFLGDFINNGIAKTLASSDIPVSAIWGNNDGDRVRITKTSLDPKSNLTISDNTHDIFDIDEKKIFATHYPALAKPMAKSGDFDVVLYGHDHKKHQEMIDNCLMLNPGEISAHKTGTASYAIYDTEAHTAEIYDLKNTLTVKTAAAKDYIKSKMKFPYDRK